MFQLRFISFKEEIAETDTKTISCSLAKMADGKMYDDAFAHLYRVM